MTSSSATISPTTRAIADFEVRGVRFSIDVAEMPHPPQGNPYFRRSQLGHLYEPVMTFCLADILAHEEDPRFLDVGSRMGYYASFVAAFTGDGRRVHAVEADPAYAPRTGRSCAVTGYPDVTVHNVILSDAEGTAKVDGEMGVVYVEPSEGTLRATTADALCAEEGFEPTIVKMDVHGSEGKILMGMETVLREHVRYLLLELHDAFLLDRYSPGITRSRILRYLEELGFSLFHVGAEAIPYPFVRDEGFTYRTLKSGDARTDLFFDRGSVVFVLASKSPDIASVIGPSVDNPLYF
jgi:FkbM family methyltransferase